MTVRAGRRLEAKLGQALRAFFSLLSTAGFCFASEAAAAASASPTYRTHCTSTFPFVVSVSPSFDFRTPWCFFAHLF